MAVENEVAIQRLADQMGALRDVVLLRIETQEKAIEANNRAHTQTLLALSDVVKAQAATVESTYMRRDTYQIAHSALEKVVTDVEKDVAKIETKMTWIARTSLTAFALPIVVTIIATILLTGKW